jgi:DNA-binding NtrC family response regulator
LTDDCAARTISGLHAAPYAGSLMLTPVRLIGVSAAIRAVEEEIGYAARSDAKVLVTGESGAGKEVVARLIHQGSNRRHGPLVTINCAGFPDTLLESELFGHVKGSFTDAHADKGGWLQAAHGGTIFMDEVGEMSLRMQALLLRFLETGEIQRLGANRLPRIDDRVITATHRSLAKQVAEKLFREDLYYRLNVINITVPPLRERREDIFVLLQHFLELAADADQTPIPQVTRSAMKHLMAYDWPGNVRELRNVAERVVARSQNGLVDVDQLPEEVVEPRESAVRDQALGAVDVLFQALVSHQASFWPDIHARYMARDLNRHEIRTLIGLGLEHTRGSYKMLVSCFNMPPGDYKRFLTFLHKHRCHVRYQPFRTVEHDSHLDALRPVLPSPHVGSAQPAQSAQTSHLQSGDVDLASR